MGKRIENYRDVKNNTTGANYYGNNAHKNSVEEFKSEHGHRPNMDNAQELRDRAEQRQNHWDIGAEYTGDDDE
jgi:hypothetical protein